MSQIPQYTDKRLPDIPNLEISNDGVEKLIKNLKMGKSSGPDNLLNRVLKEVEIAGKVLTLPF